METSSEAEPNTILGIERRTFLRGVMVAGLVGAAVSGCGTQALLDTSRKRTPVRRAETTAYTSGSARRRGIRIPWEELGIGYALTIGGIAALGSIAVISVEKAVNPDTRL